MERDWGCGQRSLSYLACRPSFLNHFLCPTHSFSRPPPGRLDLLPLCGPPSTSVCPHSGPQPSGPALQIPSHVGGRGPHCAARQPPSLHWVGGGVGRKGTRGDRGRASVEGGQGAALSGTEHSHTGPAGLKDPACAVPAWGPATPWLTWSKALVELVLGSKLQTGRFTPCRGPLFWASGLWPV